MTQKLKLLVLGAHPDDAEFHAGGLITKYREYDHDVRMISVTDGGAGHQSLEPARLREIRRAEARASGESIGARYDVWEFPDGELLPTLEVRRRIIREIREFAPDLVLTHRTNDYHPDHRAVGQAVQDASFMVTVPLVTPTVPALRRDPVVAYLPDTFTKPAPLRPDVVIDISDRVDKVVAMMAHHRSQFFDWLPYNQRIEQEVPCGEAERFNWLRGWYLKYIDPRLKHFATAISEQLGPVNRTPMAVEVYEISEYAAQATPADLRRLFLTNAANGSN